MNILRNVVIYLGDSTKSSTIFDRLGMFEFWRDFLLSVRNQSEIYPTSKLCLLFVCKQTQLLLSRAKILYYQKKFSIWILFWSLVKIDVRFHVQNIINLFCCSTLSLFPKSLSSLMSKSSILLIGTTIALCQKLTAQAENRGWHTHHVTKTCLAWNPLCRQD